MQVSRASSLLCLVVLATALSACDEAGSLDEAETLVRDFMAQAASGEGDSGWSLLHPVTQQAHYDSNLDAYRAAAAAVDWDSFEWTIGGVTRDDPNRYEVILLVADGGEAPEFITSLATWMQGPSSPGPIFYLLYEQSGGSGIYEPGPS